MASLPERTCIGCRRRAPKPDLVRIVRRSDGSVAWDRSGNTPGRGAYVCSKPGCFEKAARRGRFGGALRAEVGASEIERLRREFA